MFNVVTDPDRLPRWLPEQLRVADTGQRCLRVAWIDRDATADRGTAGQAGTAAEWPEYRLMVQPEQLRVEWRPSGPDGWAGYLQVRESPAGGATAEVCVEPTGRAGEDRASDRVPGIVDGSLANLRTEVADNLTAG